MLRFVLVCGAFLCLALPANAQGNGAPQDAGRHQSASKAKTDPAKIAPTDYGARIDFRLGQIARLLDAKIADDESAKENDRAERNIKAQENVANWGLPMFILGAIEIIITAVGVGLVVRTINQSRADTEDDIRPYVQISRCKFEFGPGHKNRFVVKIQNSGQTPATFFEVFFATEGIEQTETGAKWVMPDPAKFTSHKWNALGGGDTMTGGLYPPRFLETITNVSHEQKLLFVMGKVRYGDVWGNEYETEFAYWLKDLSPTLVGNTVTGVSIKARTMSRATGALRTFERVKFVRKRSRWFGNPK